MRIRLIYGCKPGVQDRPFGFLGGGFDDGGLIWHKGYVGGRSGMGICLFGALGWSIE